jgi:hypothetical protein
MQYLLRKQIIFLFIILSSSFAAYSQNDEVYRPNNDEKHFYNSINIGLVSNYMDFQRGSYFSNRGNLLYPSFNKAIVMGLSGTYRLNKHFLIRFNPNLLINDAKDFSYKKSFSDSIVYKMSIPTTILNLPIALKLESDRYDFFKRPDFMRHYVFGGIKLDYDNSASKVVNGTDEDGNKDITTYYNLLNAIDYGYEFGLGLSFYLPYVTVSPEIKFSYGQQDLRKTIYPIFYGLNKLTTNYVFFTMHVEWEW